MHLVSFAVILILLHSVSVARAKNIANEIEDLYSEIGSLSEDENTEKVLEETNEWLEEMDEDERMEFEGRYPDDKAIENDPEITEVANKDYDNAMGRIIAVNLAHWRKRQEKRQLQEKREYQGNVQEMIETTNEAEGFFFDQGDMILDCDLYEELHPGKTCKTGQARTKRNALRTRKRLWTSRVIPYKIPSYMRHIVRNLNKVIQMFHRVSCIRFVPYRGQKNYIFFDNDDGCSSKVGKSYAVAGAQKLSLGQGCDFEGTIIHELLHALGFFHEQARDDRDKYIEIKWENILDGFSDQFDKYSYKTIDKIGKNYDFQSIMHYDRRAFTKNGLDTIIRFDKPVGWKDFGTPQKTMSPQDIVELNALYDCETKNYGWTQWSGFTPCDKDCMKERQRYCYNAGNPKACGGNVNVYGIETERVKCGSYECPVRINGHWGRWSDWSTCDVSCDDGKRKRFRKCDNPEPKHGGKYCAGESVEEGVCTMKRCQLRYQDTDFDGKLLGMWVNKGQIKWMRNKYFTGTKETGPSRDHTTGKGYYLYMESSAPARPGNQAILESQPWLSAPKGGQCMKFFYTMYGKTTGSLIVKLQEFGKRAKNIFTKTGDQGLHWIGAKVSLNIPEGTKYKLKIIARVGSTGYSDIAIDDVYIDPGLCSCQDDYVSCSKWKAAKHCEKNVQFMSKHCARSCDTCECKDDNFMCPAWATQPNGCSKNSDYMRSHCQKSCRVCHPPKGPLPAQPHAGNRPPPMCKDNDETQCPAWKNMGECSKNPSFMWMNCALSCGICACEDKYSKCPQWAQKGECVKNKKWMLDHCLRSCHVCACGDNHVKCGLWAKLGECGKNEKFMTEQCKKSCKKC